MHNVKSHRMSSLRGVRRPAAAALLVAVGLLSTTLVHAAEPTRPDAVILKWEQEWTLNADGSTVYHETQHVLLNNERAYDDFGDPRITYNADTDKLEVLVARTRMPGGGYRELPEYGHVEVSPDATQGWPAFAAIRQHLLVMSGLEDGCVTEMEYKITTQPGTHPYLAADLRLDHHYPIKSRIVKVVLPANTPLSIMLDHRPEQTGKQGKYATETATPAGTTTHVWTFEDIPAEAAEPQSPPWQTRGVRLAFSTLQPNGWLRDRLVQLEKAADQTDLVRQLATDWTKDCGDNSQKLRALQEKLNATFNVVNCPVSWRPASIRPASELLNCCYGLPVEATVALLALARAVELPVQSGAYAVDYVWKDEAPQEAYIAGYAIVLNTIDGPEFWDAHDGRICHDDHWAGRTTRWYDRGEARQQTFAAWTEADMSRIAVRGQLSIDGNGLLSGELSLRTSGLFVSAESLRDNAAQKRRVERLLHRVLPDAKLDSFTVEQLGAEVFDVTAKVTASKALPKIGDAFNVVLAEDGPGLAEVPLPLSSNVRENPVWLKGAFVEQINLRIKWPEGWTVVAQPSVVKAATGQWGAVSQDVELSANELRLVREIRMDHRALTAQSLPLVRDPINETQSAHARTLLVKP